MQPIKRYRYWIALALLVLPVLVRGLWFYQWFSSQPRIKAPDYAANTIPQPPLSTAATEPVKLAEGKVVVVDELHNNQFAPDQVDSLFSALTRRGARVEVASGDPSLAVRLKYASTYLVFSPTLSFSTDEINAVRSFVAGGGRLIVFTDPTHGLISTDYFTGMPSSQPDVDTANDLLAPFGLSVRNDYLYNLVKNEGNFRNILFGKFGSNALTNGLGQVALYGVHSIDTVDGTPLLIGDANTYSSQTDSAGAGMAAAALSADGGVLAMGDFTFLVPPYDSVADNAVLIDHIADFALGGTRTHSVANFPYVFDQTVYVVPTGGMRMTADVLGPFANLQTALRVTNTSLLVKDTPPATGDLLVIGTLQGDVAASPDLLPYIDSFGLNFDDPTTIVIPNFGTVDRSGVGLLLYQHSASRNILVLLTDTPDDLPSLIDLLASGSLESCVVQGEVGVCGIGSGNNYFGQSSPGFSPTETPTPAG
ncbi:MAG TPA: DUF4350 domain-containing protein [Anaerolineales bacterium]|nr:DUF4350 domain-containing protein [Anaerolineales bacterium]